MEFIVIAGFLSVGYALFDWYEESNQRRSTAKLFRAIMSGTSSSPPDSAVQSIILRSKCVRYIKQRRQTGGPTPRLQHELFERMNWNQRSYEPAGTAP